MAGRIVEVLLSSEQHGMQFTGEKTRNCSYIVTGVGEDTDWGTLRAGSRMID